VFIRIRRFERRHLLSLTSCPAPPKASLTFKVFGRFAIALHTIFERMVHRIIPLDGRPHVPDHVRLWHGDSVSHWGGNTKAKSGTREDKN